MFPCGQSSSASPLPLYAAFPRSEYYQRIRLPLQRLPFSGMIHFVRHTRCASAAHQDLSGSLRFLDTSFYERAVRSDPAAVSSHLALDGDLPCAFQPLRLCRPADDLLNEAEPASLSLRPARSLCLRLAHVVASMSPRLDSGGAAHSPAEAGISPAGSIRLVLTPHNAGTG